jgi:hypothetical protein
MKTSENVENITKAMIAAAVDIQSVPKTKQALRYKYATLDNIIDMLRGTLPKHGLWFIQMPQMDIEKNIMILTTRVLHTSGEWFEDYISFGKTELKGGDSNDTQRLGASITYFRRYALSAIFGIAADDDNDGEPAPTPGPQNRQPQQNRQPAPGPQNASSGAAKKDPMVFVLDAMAKMMTNGETKDSVLKGFADILKTDNVRSPEKMSKEEINIIARHLWQNPNFR